MTTIDSIIEKFRERFVKRTSSSTIGSSRSEMIAEYNILNVRKPETIESFIRTEFEAREKELCEKLESTKKEQLDKNDPDNYGACYAIGGFNDALDKAIALIKNKP